MLSCAISGYALQQYYTLLFHGNVLLEDINAKYRQRIYFSIKCFLNGNNAGANSNLTTPVAYAAYSAVSLFDLYKKAIFNEKSRYINILKRY